MTTKAAMTYGIALAALVSATNCFAMPAGNPPADAPRPSPSLHQGNTQRDLDHQAGTDYKAADREMNHVYTAVLSKYAKDTAFIAKFRTAQRAWLVFRDAEVAATYPDPDTANYGSVYPMCVDSVMAELTKQRTEQLKVWLKGTEEGDVCSGSIDINGDPD